MQTVVGQFAVACCILFFQREFERRKCVNGLLHIVINIVFSLFSV